MFWRENDGFTIPVYESPAKAVEALEAGTAKWTYNKPTGEGLQWFRLDDFAGYEHTQPDWFKDWVGIQKWTNNDTYTCTMPSPPVVGFYGMIQNFAAWPKTKTSSNPVDGESLYRVGLLAWIENDPNKKAYFVNFGKMTDRQLNSPIISTLSKNVPLKTYFKIAPVVTSYGFGSDEP